MVENERSICAEGNAMKTAPAGYAFETDEDGQAQVVGVTGFDFESLDPLPVDTHAAQLETARAILHWLAQDVNTSKQAGAKLLLTLHILGITQENQRQLAAKMGTTEAQVSKKIRILKPVIFKTLQGI